MHLRARKKKLAVPIAALVFIGSVVLLMWTSGVYYRPLPKPAFAFQLPFVSLQAGADDKGLHLIAMSQSGRQVPTIHIEAGFSADAKYHHGHVLNVLGLMIAALSAEYDGGDYSISPYTALVLPYWLLIVGSGYLLAVLTPIATLLRPYCRVSKCSGGAGGVVLVLFVAMNVVPSAWCPGPAVQPQVIAEWIELTFEPGQAYSEIMLVYGFPDTCYKRGIVNRQSVDLFYGMSVGWKPHKAMENICVAALTALAFVMVIEFLRQRRAGVQTGPPKSGKGRLADGPPHTT